MPTENPFHTLRNSIYIKKLPKMKDCLHIDDKKVYKWLSLAATSGYCGQDPKEIQKDVPRR